MTTRVRLTGIYLLSVKYIATIGYLPDETQHKTTK